MPTNDEKQDAKAAAAAAKKHQDADVTANAAKPASGPIDRLTGEPAAKPSDTPSGPPDRMAGTDPTPEQEADPAFRGERRKAAQAEQDKNNAAATEETPRKGTGV